MTSERPRIGVVVGEGNRARTGLLRFVLEGEGLLVLAEARSAVELVQALAIHRPDAVVLDDGIGATAVVVTREMCPAAKVVLVWPPHLVPINGDARVDPTEVLRELGPAVERACGLDRPAPAPAEVRTLPTRPADDLAQDRDRGTADVLPGPGFPRPHEPDEADAIIVDEAAPVLILPVTPAVEPEPRA